MEKLHRQPVILYGSGRTDSGVHAMGQAANFFSPIDSIPVENYPRALNSILPKDIRILNAEVKDESFNSRFSATSRVYRYFIMEDKFISANQTKAEPELLSPGTLYFLCHYPPFSAVSS